MDKKKDPLDYEVPREPLSPEEEAQVELFRKVRQAQEERAALKKKNLH
jgi:hypothetical protein